MKTILGCVSLLCLVVAAGSASAGPPKPTTTTAPPPKAPPADLVISNAGVVERTLVPGGWATLRADIENRGATPASVALGGMLDTSKPTVRSPSKLIQPHTRSTFTVRVLIDPVLVRADRIQPWLFVADPRTPINNNFLSQVWQDATVSNNRVHPTFPVVVQLFNVTINLASIAVLEDCNPGPATSNWHGVFTAGSADPSQAFPPPNQEQRVWFRPGYQTSNPAIGLWWPAPNRFQTVSSSQIYPINRTHRLTNVGRNRHLAMHFWAALNNGVFADQHGYVGEVDAFVAPERWRSGTTVTFDNGPMWSTQARIGRCGHHPFRVTFRIDAVPVAAPI